MAFPPPEGLTFARSRRLKAGRDFRRAKSKGQRLPCGCLIANWLYLPESEATRLGVITSKNVGPAVARSRARRLLREAIRLHQHELAGPMDLVLVARRSIVGKMLGDVEKDFMTAARKAKFLKSARA